MKTTDRKRKRKHKYRGHRTFGGGDTKNRRGSGTKGGKGRAGSKKHKFSKYYMFAGMARDFKPKPKGIAVNVEYFEQKHEELLAKKLLEQSGGFIVADGTKLGIEKVLGKGKLSKKFLFKNFTFSEKARQKVIGAGGKIEGEEAKAIESE